MIINYVIWTKIYYWLYIYFFFTSDFLTILNFVKIYCFSNYFESIPKIIPTNFPSFTFLIDFEIDE